MTVRISKLKVVFILMCIILTSRSLAQKNLEWSKAVDSIYFGEMVNADAGGTYTTGIFYGTQDFDPGPGVFNMTAAAGGENFLMKLDASGGFVWAKQFGGGANIFDITGQLSVDSWGNLYSMGNFSGTRDFDPGTGVFNLTAAAPGYDGYIIKFNSSGDLVWVRQLTGGDYLECRGLALDAAANIHITGCFGGTMDFDPGQGTYNMSNPAVNIFVAKYDSSGSLIWAEQMEGADAPGYGRDIQVDAAGNIYSCGYMWNYGGPIDFNPSTAPGDTFYLYSNPLFMNAGYVFKLDAAGHFKWAKLIYGDTADVTTFAMTLDAAANVYTTGRTSRGAIDYDPGSGPGNAFVIDAPGDGIYLSKLDSAGNFLWARVFSDVLVYTYPAGRSLAIADNGDVYLGGFYRGTVDFDPGPGVENLSSYGLDADMFILRLTPEGNFVWVDGFEADGPGGNTSIMLADPQTLYATGYFNTGIDCDPGPGMDYHYSTLLGGIGHFILKLSCNSFNKMEKTACNSYTLNGSTYNVSGIYTQTYPNGSGCDSILTLDLSIEPLDMGVFQNGPELTANAAGNIYQWIDCNTGSAIPGATAQTYTATASGSYAVIIDKTACIDTSSCFQVVIAGVQALSTKGVFSISPNPATEQVKIAPVKPFNNAEIRLMDMTGKTVLVKSGVKGTFCNWDLREIAAGVYILDINEGGVSTKTRLVRR